MARIKVSYERVGIPHADHEAIARHIRENPQLGYTSVSELARAALREYLLSRKAASREKEA